MGKKSKFFKKSTYSTFSTQGSLTSPKFRKIAEIFEKPCVVVSRVELLQRNVWGLITSPSISCPLVQDGVREP